MCWNENECLDRYIWNNLIICVRLKQKSKITSYCSWIIVYCRWVDYFECVGMRIGVWQNKYFDHFEK